MYCRMEHNADIAGCASRRESDRHLISKPQSCVYTSLPPSDMSPRITQQASDRLGTSRGREWPVRDVPLLGEVNPQTVTTMLGILSAPALAEELVSQTIAVVPRVGY